MLHIQLHMLWSFVDQRLSAVTDDICQRFAATLAEYERELLRLNAEIRRQRRLLRAAGAHGDKPEDEVAGILLSFTPEEEQEVKGQSTTLHSTQKHGGTSQPDDAVRKFLPCLDEELQSAESQLEGVKQEVDERNMTFVRAEICSEQEDVQQNLISDKVPQVREWVLTAHPKGEEDGALGQEDTGAKMTKNQLEDFGVKQDQNEDHMIMEISSQLEDYIHNFTTEAEQQVGVTSDNLEIKTENNDALGPGESKTKLTLSTDWQKKVFIEEEQPPDFNSNTAAQLEPSNTYSDHVLSETVFQTPPGIQSRPPPHQNRLICNGCGREFSSKTTLKKHIRRYTTKDQDQMSCNLRRQRAPFKKPTKLFSCKICRGSFYSQGILLRHAEGHCKEPESQCGVCGDCLPSTKSLTEHIQSHRERGSTCNLNFSRRETLERHLKAHSGERPHSCGLCRKSFTRREYMIRHLNRAHKLTK